MPNFTIEAEDIPLDIVFEDDHLLVINKPASMVTHPARGHFSGTLVNAVLGHTARLSKIGGDYRPGIVHRLDKDTSGLLIVAKTETSHVALSEGISKRLIKRIYRALVWGKPKMESGLIEANIGHNPKDHKKMAVVAEGKPAVTEYKCLSYFDFLTDVRLKLHTGRTHQIRVHMSSIGHPVFGDFDYGGREERLTGIVPDQRLLASSLLKRTNRQLLHAERLEFKHPVTGEDLVLSSEIPEDMAEVFNELRGGNPV